MKILLTILLVIPCAVIGQDSSVMTTTQGGFGYPTSRLVIYDTTYATPIYNTEWQIAVKSEPKKWQKITKNDISAMGTYGLAGAADGLNESVQHHRFGMGKEWWDYRHSWRNKYRDYPTDKRSAYPFSKNLLAFTTDAYHFTRAVSNGATLATIAIVASDLRPYPKKDRWKVVAKKLVLSVIANRIFFNAVYLTTNNSK